MRIAPRKLLALSGGLLLAGALGACSLIPDQPVGDPLNLNGTTLGMVDLSYLDLEGEPEPASLSPSTHFFIGVDADGRTTVSTVSGVILSHLTREPAAPGPQPHPGLPAELPLLPTPPLTDTDALANRVIQDMLQSRSRDSTSPPSVPDQLTAEDIKRSQLAMERLSQLEEQRRQAQEEQLRAIRERTSQQQKQLQELQKRQQELAQQRKNQLELLNRHRAEQRRLPEPELNWGLPMPFHIPGGERTGVPAFAARIVNSLRQPINISTIEIGVPEGTTSVEGYPEEIRLAGYALTVTAAERSGSTITSFPAFAQQEMLDEPIVFQHVGDGVYERTGNTTMLTMAFKGDQVRLLGNALINGHEVYGNVDMSFAIEPRFPSNVSLNFTIEAGEAILRF